MSFQIHLLNLVKQNICIKCPTMWFYIYLPCFEGSLHIYFESLAESQDVLRDPSRDDPVDKAPHAPQQCLKDRHWPLCPRCVRHNPQQKKCAAPMVFQPFWLSLVPWNFCAKKANPKVARWKPSWVQVVHRTSRPNGRPKSSWANGQFRYSRHVLGSYTWWQWNHKIFQNLAK